MISLAEEKREMATPLQTTSTPAVVIRPGQRAYDPDQYLRLAPGASPGWTTNPAAATSFESMREATRAALHLPSALRAFSIPLSNDLRGLLN